MCSRLFSKAHCSERVCGFTRLADDNENIVFVENRISIAEFTCDINNNGNACKLFECVAGNNACMVRGATCGDEHTACSLPFVTELHFVEFDINWFVPLLYKARAQRVGKRFWLLVDFLEHEVSIAA